MSDSHAPERTRTSVLATVSKSITSPPPTSRVERDALARQESTAITVAAMVEIAAVAPAATALVGKSQDQSEFGRDKSGVMAASRKVAAERAAMTTAMNRSLPSAGLATGPQ